MLLKRLQKDWSESSWYGVAHAAVHLLSGKVDKVDPFWQHCKAIPLLIKEIQEKTTEYLLDKGVESVVLFRGLNFDPEYIHEPLGDDSMKSLVKEAKNGSVLREVPYIPIWPIEAWTVSPELQLNLLQ